MAEEIRKEDISPLALTRGYKYKLERTFTAQLPIILEKDIMSDCGLIILNRTGFLIVKPGLPWDGASGLTVDTASSQRGAFVHDVLYLLIRQGHLPLFFKTLADDILRDVCILDGMWEWRADSWYVAVQAFGMEAATKKRKVYIYPKSERRKK